MGCGSSNVASSKKNIHETQLRHVQGFVPNPRDALSSPSHPEWVQALQTNEATIVVPIPSSSYSGGGGGSCARPGDQTASSCGGEAPQHQAHSQVETTQISSQRDTVMPSRCGVLTIEGSCVRNVLFNCNDGEGESRASLGSEVGDGFDGSEDETLQPLDLRPSVASQAPSFQSSGSQWMVASSNTTLDNGYMSSDEGGGSFGASRDRIKRDTRRGSSNRLPVGCPPRRQRRYADAIGDNDSLCSPPLRRATRGPPNPPAPPPQSSSSSLPRKSMSFRLDEEEKGSDQKAIMSLSSPSQAAGDDTRNNAAGGGAPREETAVAPPSSFTLYGARHRTVPLSSPLSECSSTMARIDQTRFLLSEDPTMIRSIDSVVSRCVDDTEDAIHHAS